MKKLGIAGVIVAVLLIVVVGTVAYSFLKTPEEASAPIEAVPIALEATATQLPATNTPVSEPTPTFEPIAEPTATEQAEVEEATAVPATATPEPTATPEATATPEPAPESAQPTIFEIDQANSTARFYIDEILRGDPFTVIGVTDQIAGQIAIDPQNPANTQVGTILVNARTITTDNDFRNRAIKNRILLTDNYEFVTFAPKEINGLPEAVAVGETFTFEIVGDLTVTDVTNEVVFEVTVTPVNEDQITGIATTTILYADYNLRIPDAQAVSAVADEVILELEFTANAL